MRTIIDLPEELHLQLLSIARDTSRTLSETAVELMRRGLGAGRPAKVSSSARTGLPVVRIGRPVTSEDVRSLEDVAVLDGLSDDERHQFWPDDVSYRLVALDGVVGHRQVTDAYLADLARRHHGRLATFDRGLAAVHADIADLVSLS